MGEPQPTNDEIAGVLDEIADLLEAQDANPFRVRSYREGANTVRQVDEPLAQIVQREGADALQRLPSIGQGLAGLIGEYVETGRSDLLDRLRGEVSPESVFKKVPAIGEQLARRIAAELDIRSLEELEEAAHDGRLAQVPGIGPKRLHAVRTSLAGLPGRRAHRPAPQRTSRAEAGARGGCVCCGAAADDMGRACAALAIWSLVRQYTACTSMSWRDLAAWVIRASISARRAMSLAYSGASSIITRNCAPR